jgi:hypothetical protein
MLARLKTLLPHKLRATGIHFLLSLGLFAILLYLILFHWYPGLWFALDGGWQGVRIMVGVDLVLGPVLTFLLFNPAKSRIAIGIDFGFIAAVQTAALVWGIYAVHGQRPLAIAYCAGTFYSLDASSRAFRQRGPGVLDGFGRRPVMVYVELPPTQKEKMDLAMEFFSTGQAEYEHPELYRPLKPNLDKVFAQQVDIQALSRHAPGSLERLRRRHPEVSPAELRYVDFEGRYQQAILVFKADGTLIDYLPPLPLQKAAARPAKNRAEPKPVRNPAT